MNNTLLICDNSADGIFSAIYDAYLLKCDEALTHIQVKPYCQALLGTQSIDIISDDMKFDKVMNTLKKKFQPDSVKDLFYCLSSYDAKKADAIYHAIALGLSIYKEGGNKKADVMANLANPYVLTVSKLARNVWYEAHHFMGFLRFEQRSGVLFAEFSPKNDVIPLIMPHFADRLMPENFIVYDVGRKTFGVHPAHRGWFLSDIDWLYANSPAAFAILEIFEGKADSGEAELAGLFQLFCKTVSVEDRENEKLRRNNLPLRFREYMTEFKEAALKNKRVDKFS